MKNQRSEEKEKKIGENQESCKKEVEERNEERKTRKIIGLKKK